MQAPLEGGLGGVGSDKPKLLLLNSDSNKIGDRGCRYIGVGGWLLVRGVVIGIIQNISDCCGVREEGCRAMTKRRLGWIGGILAVIQLMAIKSEWSASAS